MNSSGSNTLTMVKNRSTFRETNKNINEDTENNNKVKPRHMKSKSQFNSSIYQKKNDVVQTFNAKD